MYFNHMIFVILSVNIMMCTSMPYLTRKTRYCGTQLAETLMMLCSSGYRSPFWDDVTVSPSTIKVVDPNIDGIVNECCRRGCTRQTLANYCVDTRRKIRESDISSADNTNLREVPPVLEQGTVTGPKVDTAHPEVGKHGRRKGHVGDKGRKLGKNGNGGRKGRRGRARNCICERDESARRKRPVRARKIDIINIERSPPVVGTVSPEYLKLPRTLGEVPEPYRDFSFGF